MSQITTLSARTITVNIAKSAAQLTRHLHCLRQAETPRDRRRQFDLVEREIEAITYWLSVLMADSSRSGWLLNKGIQATHDLLEVATLTVRIVRQRETLP